MKLATLGVVLGMTLTLAARPAAADEPIDCDIVKVWRGPSARGLQATVAGDHLLVRASGRQWVVDRDGGILSDRAAPSDGIDGQLLGGDTAFFDVTTGIGAEVSVTRLELDGTTATAPVVLAAGAPDVMNPAQADYGDGVLAVAWARPQAQYARARDLHVALLREDGSLLARDVIVGREGAYAAIPAVQGDVVWVLWREDPYLQLKGVRFSAIDGARLDAEPIAIGRDYNGFMVARSGAALHLYADTPSGAMTVFDLAVDGTVTQRASGGAYGRQVVGLPSGDVLHVAPPAVLPSEFPGLGTTTIVRETAAAVVPFLVADSAEAVVLAADNDVLVVTIHDTVAGAVGASSIELRRVSPTGTVVATTELVRGAMVQVDQEVCSYPDYGNGCSAAATPARAALPLLTALLLVLARRRGRGRRA